MNLPALLLTLLLVNQPVDWRVGPAEGGGGRVLFAADPVLLALAGDPEHVPDLSVAATADESGKVAHPLLGSGWAYCAYESDAARTVLVEGRGFHSLFVNGDRFAGDFYRSGNLLLPIPLRKGTNHLLVRALRGEFTIRFSEAPGSASLSKKDAVLPDLREGALIDLPGAVVVLNHLGSVNDDAVLEVGDGRVFERTVKPVGPVLPHGLRKPAFPLRQLREPEPEELDPKGRYPLVVTLRRGADAYTAVYPMDVRGGLDPYRETRISGIDGSVQYHAIRPPFPPVEGRTFALYLSLHGAGVKAWNQARAYRNKRDAFVVAPTNRRRFGFDWQDWGRIDALEALDHALARYPVDPHRVYLTGHSMGGHGTWYLGTLYASRFAAVAPSAGWASFFTYGGGMVRDYGIDPALTPFERTQLENDTTAFIENLAGTPVYVLHGENDDNVPLSEARRMLALLAGFHHHYASHVQPGAGHWWGDECVDWLPLFEFCRRHRLPEAPLRFTFRTFNPAVSASYAWARIDRQEVPGEMSSIEVDADTRRGKVTVNTENVAGFSLDLGRVFSKGTVELRWNGGAEPVAPGPIRRGFPVGRSFRQAGPFKLAFQNRMVWVYGTRGTPEENAAVLAKVRYDQEVWWYRGNGDVLAVADRDFRPERFEGRNVILYGNEDVNSAFKKVLPEDCPIRVRRGVVAVGDRTYEGDVGAFLVYPKKDSAADLVGVVGAATARAMRMAQQARYFISGTAVPDWVVYGDDTLVEGMAGVADSGYFGNDWGLSERNDWGLSERK